MTVDNLNKLFATFRQRGVMGNKQYGRPLFLIELRQQLKDGIGAATVEIASWFVCQQQCGVHRQRAGDRDPLLLTAAQVVRQMILPGR